LLCFNTIKSRLLATVYIAQKLEFLRFGTMRNCETLYVKYIVRSHCKFNAIDICSFDPLIRSHLIFEGY